MATALHARGLSRSYVGYSIREELRRRIFAVVLALAAAAFSRRDL